MMTDIFKALVMVVYISAICIALFGLDDNTKGGY